MQITLEMINVFRKRENGNYPIGYLLLTLAFRILLWQFVELVQWGLWECYCRQLSIIICNQFIASKYFHSHIIYFNFFPSHVYHALKLNSVLIDAIFWYLHQLNIPRGYLRPFTWQSQLDSAFVKAKSQSDLFTLFKSTSVLKVLLAISCIGK